MGSFPLTKNYAEKNSAILKVLKQDVLQSERPMAITKFKRDKKDEVTGFYVSNERIRNLWFEKQK